VPQNTPSNMSAGAGTPDPVQVRLGLREALLRARNADGGWAYSSGKRTRLEPTCWALLALAAADSRPVELERLRSWSQRDGWLIDVAGAPPNQPFNALAALTLLQDASTAPLARPIVSNLLSAKSLRYSPGEKDFPDDGTIQAWSWVEGTASWVEPTAWSLLLLKHLRRNGALPAEGTERIDVGERFLFDRVCSIGGWNYGNKMVFGQNLWPYVPTTALALLALQDRRDLPSVTGSLAQMHKDLRTERSTLALALALVCSKLYSRHRQPESGITPLPIDGSHSDRGDAVVEGELATLAARDLEMPDENLLGQAVALYALSDPAHAPKIFLF
jgi:hypothetical protein